MLAAHFSNAKTVLKSFFMLTTGQPRLIASSQALSSWPTLRLAIVGVFALGVVVVEQKHEPRTRAVGRVLQHLQVAIRIAERQDRPPADVQVDVDLACPHRRRGYSAPGV